VSPSCARRAATLVLVLLGLAAWKRPHSLTTLVRGGAGPPTLVLLHGYRSSAGEWEDFAGTIAPESGCRFIFPEGPRIVAGHPGETHGHAWFAMNLESFKPVGGSFPDLSRANPDGLWASAASVRTLLADPTVGDANQLPVLGGFSQGAMVAGEVAFNSDQRIAALVLLSVTPVDEAAWVRGFARRRGLAVFIAHGRVDQTLSFAAAERLQTEMRDAGLAVTWHPFPGGHEMPGEVVAALNDFLAAQRLVPRRPGGGNP
jgi:phospholipase/carboxylesterase